MKVPRWNVSIAPVPASRGSSEPASESDEIGCQANQLYMALPCKNVPLRNAPRRDVSSTMNPVVRGDVTVSRITDSFSGGDRRCVVHRAISASQSDPTKFVPLSSAIVWGRQVPTGSISVRNIWPGKCGLTLWGPAWNLRRMNRIPTPRPATWGIYQAVSCVLLFVRWPLRVT